MRTKTIAIIGAGASGLMCAIAALRRCAEDGKTVRVVLFEKNQRAGKKLLITGSGRCNLTNTQQPLSAYHTNDKKTAAAVLDAFCVNSILHFFEQIGLSTVHVGSLVYPRSMQASSVLDVLRFEAERLGAEFICSQKIESIEKTDKRYNILSKSGVILSADAVIAALGSEAGGGENGYALLENLGHTVYTPYPALTPLLCDTSYIKTAAGMRTNAQISLEIDQKQIKSEYGEVLFTDYGLSGIAAMQLSGEASKCFLQGKKHGVYAVLDLAPEYSYDELCSHLRARRSIFLPKPLEHLLCGFLNKRVGMAAVKASGIGSLSAPISQLSDRRIKALAALLKGWKIPVTGVKGAPSAQTMGGGAALDEFYADTLQSKKMKGLFACGEVLDVYGDCGGYNLTWAWASGFTAGRGAAQQVLL